MFFLSFVVLIPFAILMLSLDIATVDSPTFSAHHWHSDVLCSHLEASAGLPRNKPGIRFHPLPNLGAVTQRIWRRIAAMYITGEQTLNNSSNLNCCHVLDVLVVMALCCRVALVQIHLQWFSFCTYESKSSGHSNDRCPAWVVLGGSLFTLPCVLSRLCVHPQLRGSRAFRRECTFRRVQLHKTGDGRWPKPRL